jgi:hypothetical protein
MLICRFTIRKSVDPDEFRNSIDTVLSKAMTAGATRVGKVDAFRLLQGDTTDIQRRYQLEIDGLMLLPPQLADALKSAGAGAIATSSYAEVLARGASQVAS